MEKIEVALAPAGVLSGYVVTAGGHVRPPDHLHEFTTAADLRTFLGRYFPCVAILESRYPGRDNVYSRAAQERGRLGGWHY
jgi:hypothetical protein